MELLIIINPWSLRRDHSTGTSGDISLPILRKNLNKALFFEVPNSSVAQALVTG